MSATAAKGITLVLHLCEESGVESVHYRTFDVQSKIILLQFGPHIFCPWIFSGADTV